MADQAAPGDLGAVAAIGAKAVVMAGLAADQVAVDLAAADLAAVDPAAVDPAVLMAAQVITACRT